MAKVWQRALVTGGSGGIGEAFARRLATLGTDLVLVARDEARMQKLADELDDVHGVDVEVLPADLGDPAQRRAVEARLAATENAVDLLVNNAGYGFHRSFIDIPVDDEDGEIQVNVVALMRLAHALATRVCAEAKPGRGGSGPGAPVAGILNVSSTASFQPGIRLANYAATKAYVTSFSQGLHEELKPYGIAVTCLCPGLTRTDFQAKSGTNVRLPSFVWQEADEVAATGLDAVSRGRALVVSGLFNKALQVSSRLAPVSVVRWVSAEVFERVR